MGKRRRAMSCGQKHSLRGHHALRIRSCADPLLPFNLAMGEIIVYSGSILVIVCKVTGHRVTFQGSILTSYSFPSLYFWKANGKESTHEAILLR